MSEYIITRTNPDENKAKIEKAKKIYRTKRTIQKTYGFCYRRKQAR